mgnify:CR=1 FL=1
MINSRMLCLECVIDILEHKKHSHLVINETLDNYRYLEKRDRAFINRVCTGTIERCIEIDYVINQLKELKTRYGYTLFDDAFTRKLKIKLGRIGTFSDSALLFLQDLEV